MKLRNRLKKIKKLACAFLLVGISFSKSSYAATFGASMPWDTPLKNVQGALTGNTAHICIVIAIALSGLAFAFGEHGSALRKAFSIIFGGSIAIGASSVYATLQFGGALV